MNLHPKDCYYQIKDTSIFLWDYCNSIINNEKISKIRWPDYYEFDSIPISLDKIDKEPILKKIHKKFPIKLMGITRIKPNICYVWHRDGKRGTSINMIISEKTDSKCLFGIGGKYNSEEELNYDEFRSKSNGCIDPLSIVVNFITLTYIPKKFYLFNNQILHTVLNFKENRYMFTVEFEENLEKLSYEDVFNWMKKENLLITA